MLDPTAMAAALAPIIKDAVQRETAPLLERIAQLESAAPKDGIGLAGALIDRSGSLKITLSDGSIVDLGAVVGKDGDDGKDGQSWEDMEVKRTGPRTIELSFDHGERRNTFELEFPVPLYRGAFAEGEAYAHGDMVSWAGSLWHCNDATGDKPGDGSKSWTLAAKRGRDGKDFAGPQAIKKQARI